MAPSAPLIPQPKRPHNRITASQPFPPTPPSRPSRSLPPRAACPLRKPLRQSNLSHALWTPDADAALLETVRQRTLHGSTLWTSVSQSMVRRGFHSCRDIRACRKRAEFLNTLNTATKDEPNKLEWTGDTHPVVLDAVQHANAAFKCASTNTKLHPADVQRTVDDLKIKHEHLRRESVKKESCLATLAVHESDHRDVRQLSQIVTGECVSEPEDQQSCADSNSIVDDETRAIQIIPRKLEAPPSKPPLPIQISDVVSSSPISQACPKSKPKKRPQSESPESRGMPRVDTPRILSRPITKTRHNDRNSPISVSLHVQYSSDIGDKTFREGKEQSKGISAPSPRKRPRTGAAGDTAQTLEEELNETRVAVASELPLEQHSADARKERAASGAVFEETGMATAAAVVEENCSESSSQEEKTLDVSNSTNETDDSLFLQEDAFEDSEPAGIEEPVQFVRMVTHTYKKAVELLSTEERRRSRWAEEEDRLLSECLFRRKRNSSLLASAWQNVARWMTIKGFPRTATACALRARKLHSGPNALKLSLPLPAMPPSNIARRRRSRSAYEKRSWTEEEEHMLLSCLARKAFEGGEWDDVEIWMSEGGYPRSESACMQRTARLRANARCEGLVWLDLLREYHDNDGAEITHHDAKGKEHFGVSSSTKQERDSVRDGSVTAVVPLSRDRRSEVEDTRQEHQAGPHQMYDATFASRHRMGLQESLDTSTAPIPDQARTNASDRKAADHSSTKANSCQRVSSFVPNLNDSRSKLRNGGTEKEDDDVASRCTNSTRREFLQMVLNKNEGGGSNSAAPGDTESPMTSLEVASAGSKGELRNSSKGGPRDFDAKMMKRREYVSQEVRRDQVARLRAPKATTRELPSPSAPAVLVREAVQEACRDAPMKNGVEGRMRGNLARPAASQTGRTTANSTVATSSVTKRVDSSLSRDSFQDSHPPGFQTQTDFVQRHEKCNHDVSRAKDNSYLSAINSSKNTEDRTNLLAINSRRALPVEANGSEGSTKPRGALEPHGHGKGGRIEDGDQQQNRDFQRNPVLPVQQPRGTSTSTAEAVEVSGAEARRRKSQSADVHFDTDVTASMLGTPSDQDIESESEGDEDWEPSSGGGTPVRAVQRLRRSSGSTKRPSIPQESNETASLAVPFAVQSRRRMSQARLRASAISRGVPVRPRAGDVGNPHSASLSLELQVHSRLPLPRGLTTSRRKSAMRSSSRPVNSPRSRRKHLLSAPSQPYGSGSLRPWLAEEDKVLLRLIGRRTSLGGGWSDVVEWLASEGFSRTERAVQQRAKKLEKDAEGEGKVWSHVIEEAVRRGGLAVESSLEKEHAPVCGAMDFGDLNNSWYASLSESEGSVSDQEPAAPLGDMRVVMPEDT